MSTNEVLEIPGHTLIKRVGEGGMGCVFLATDNMLQRQVAIKVLSSTVSQGEEGMMRFQSEAITLAKLQHPNITMLYNLVYAKGQWCMIMEYVEGQTLETLLKIHGKLAVSQVITLAMDVLDALQHAHSKGVVHRDIKPSNLMITSEEKVKIMDFGIARIAGHSRLTRVGQAVGTPQYMSPEQVVGHEGNFASDIYSLGIVLYELLTGVTPYDSESEFEMMQAHTNRKPIPPRTLNPEVPVDLNNVILKALEKDARNRFGSAEDFKRCLLLLREHIGNEKGPRQRFLFLRKCPQFKRLDWKFLNKWVVHIAPLLERFKRIAPQYRVGSAFLAASIIMAFFVLFGTQKPLSNRNQRENFLADERLLIEIEHSNNMSTLLQGTKSPTPQRPAATPQSISGTYPQGISGTTPHGSSGTASQSASETPSQVVSRTSTQGVTAAPPKSASSTPSIQRAPEPSPKQTEETSPQKTTHQPTQSESKNASTSPSQKEAAETDRPNSDLSTTSANTSVPTLKPESEIRKMGKQVVIPRGTRVDAVLDTPYAYASAQNGMNVALRVETPLERSGVVVVEAGAKVYAVLHKNARKEELELIITEVESVTGKRIRCMNTSNKAASFKKGEKFKVNLDYNRLN